MELEINEANFPHFKQFDNGDFAYIVLLAFGRARINVTTLDQLEFVRDVY